MQVNWWYYPKALRNIYKVILNHSNHYYRIFCWKPVSVVLQPESVYLGWASLLLPLPSGPGRKPILLPESPRRPTTWRHSKTVTSFRNESNEFPRNQKRLHKWRNCFTRFSYKRLNWGNNLLLTRIERSIVGVLSAKQSTTLVETTESSPGEPLRIAAL